MRARSLFRKALFLGLLVAVVSNVVHGDSGVIIPSNRQAPDANVLSIAEMHVRVNIDSGHATVSIQQIFRNRTNQNLEGTYSLALPAEAAISDFAVWDDLTRIPGVILERKRAGELYEQIRNASIDPGLLQSGEVTESNAEGQARHSAEFTAKIVPILPYANKRVELEYRQTLPVNALTSSFVLPLKPVTYQPQTIEKFSMVVTLQDPHGIQSTKSSSQSYPLKTVSQKEGGPIEQRFEGANVTLNEDFAFEFTLSSDATPKVQAYRKGEPEEPGYFEVSKLFTAARPSDRVSAPPTVIVLFDASLSMQWEKLERSFQALEGALRALKPESKFNVLVFNSEVKAASPAPVRATPDAVAKALAFVRASRLKGGTNLQQAFTQAFTQSGPQTYFVLLSDGGATEGTIAPAKFTAWFDRTWTAKPAADRPHVYAFSIGDDANTRFLKKLASHSGVFEQVRSTEPIEFKLNAFLSKIGTQPYDGARLSAGPAENIDLVYRLDDNNFPGSRASWVGQYKQPVQQAFHITELVQESAGNTTTANVKLPAKDLSHPYLPPTWARARVDALLEKIDREGEDTATIDEIIRLSRKYKFVTPYTSFLAAPRALLRPRLIRPGDPILRVHTDAAIASVVALFPFGLTKPLRYLKSEDVWQTRFLAPSDLQDGVHDVRLILRDRDGHVYREKKTFVIASQAPVVRTKLDKARVRPGETVRLGVSASETTRTITARLYGAAPVSIRWDQDARANTGVIQVPAGLPAGRYSIHITAEDMAHNVAHEEVPLEIVP